jgi:hypothetical protein
MQATAKKPSLNGTGPHARKAGVKKGVSAKQAAKKKIIWDFDDKAKLIEAGAAIMKADKTGKMKYIQALKRAQIQVMPEEKRRPLQCQTRKQLAWFRDGVLATLRGPEPLARPEPNPDLQTLADVIGALKTIIPAFSVVAQEVHSVSERLKPLEADSRVARRLLFKMVEALDPAFLDSLGVVEEPEPAPAPAIRAPTPNGPIAVKAPSRFKAIVFGAHPTAQAEIRRQVQDFAVVTFVLEDMGKGGYRGSFTQFDAAFVTPRVTHETSDKAKEQLGPRRAIHVRGTGTKSIVEAIKAAHKRKVDDARRRFDRGG